MATTSFSYEASSTIVKGPLSKNTDASGIIVSSHSSSTTVKNPLSRNTNGHDMANSLSSNSSSTTVQDTLSKDTSVHHMATSFSSHSLPATVLDLMSKHSNGSDTSSSFSSDSSCTTVKHQLSKTAVGNETQRFFPVEHDCHYCGKSSYNLRSCTRCWWAKYCGRICQINHWKHHRLECKEDPTQSLYFKGGRVVELDMEGEEEIQEASSNEDALFLDLDKCPKHGHNDHAAFISVGDFSLEHLPMEIKRADVLEYILAQAKMTVRVLVKWTSKDRPDGDACANFRNSRRSRTASGTYVLDNPKNFQTRECNIPNCHRTADLGPKHQIYEGDLKIFTNKHVLYDEEELAQTVVDFFYDSANKSGVIREYATKLFYTKPSSDKTFLKVTIHNEDLLRRLEDLDLKRTAAFQKLSPSVLDKTSSFAIVISHPHGMPKKISVGRVLRVTEVNVSEETRANARLAGYLERKWFESRCEEDYRKFMACLGQRNLPVYKIWYDTATCQGSSGAPVLFGARQCSGTWGPFIGSHMAYDLDSGLNFLKVVQLA